MKTTEIKEEVFLMRTQSGFGEHYPSEFDELTDITAENIYNTLVEFAGKKSTWIQLFTLEYIESWLNKARQNPNNCHDLHLYEEEECQLCGYWPDARVELTYNTYTLNEIEINKESEEAVDELIDMLTETTKELDERP